MLASVTGVKIFSYDLNFHFFVINDSKTFRVIVNPLYIFTGKVPIQTFVRIWGLFVFLLNFAHFSILDTSHLSN